MATFVVGDVQGCFETLLSLTEAVGFERDRDELWLVGDLVNRGPKNLEVLRWIRDLGDRAVVVLGNHDLHLLARAADAVPRKPLDTVEDVLSADDRDALIDWLRLRPIVHQRDDVMMVHAGFLPSWTTETVRAKAEELSAALSGANWRQAIGQIASDCTSGLGAISAVLQRIRMIGAGETLVRHSGAPDAGPNGATPWFDVEHRRGAVKVVFGHWSALGLLLRPDVVCLDTGCVWGRTLTALNLEAGTVTSVPCIDALTT